MLCHFVNQIFDLKRFYKNITFISLDCNKRALFCNDLFILHQYFGLKQQNYDLNRFK